RLEQRGTRLAAAILERHGPGNLEGDFRGVDFVIRTIDQGDFNVLDFVTGKNPGLQGFFDALLDRANEFLRNGSALNAVFEHETDAGAARLNGNHAVTILTM